MSSLRKTEKFYNVKMLQVLSHFFLVFLAITILITGCSKKEEKTEGGIFLGLTTLDRQQIGIKDIQGKVVLLEFWASWCHPCKTASPYMKKLYDENKDQGFLFFAVNNDDSPSVVKKYVRREKITYPVAFSDGRLEKSIGGIYSLPTFVIIDHTGRETDKFFGFSEEIYTQIDLSVQKHLAARRGPSN